MISILSFLWFLRQTKAALFWLYLWQLKEYHLGRFLAHFSTEKGKRLIINPLLLIKLFLILSLFFYFEISLLFLVLIYVLEGILALKHYFRKTLKAPVFTKKILFLLFFSFLVISLILVGNFKKGLFNFALFLLISDIFSPAIFSGIVLVFQPLVAFWKFRIVKKAKLKRGQFKNLLVIGITGSYGKTSTKEFLATILSEKYKVLKTLEHQNSEIGIAQCILNDLNENYEIFVVEMGAYNKGGIKLISDIIKPKIGILTGVNEQHLATFGSLENIIKTKYELIESLPADGIAFFNGKNKYCLELYQKTPHQLKFGTGQAKIKKYLYGKKAKFFGEENLLGAMAVARELRMTEEEISRAVAKIENKLPGIQIKKGINGLIIIDATYSANPDGVLSHLEYLKTFPGKKVIIMPCLIELGKASKEIHKKIGKKIAEVCNLAIITTKERFKEIQEGAGEKAIFLENPKEIFEKIKIYLKPENIILLESRVPIQLISLLTG